MLCSAIKKWPTSPNSEGIQKLRIHNRSREAGLFVGRPSGIFVVEMQDEHNWWHSYSCGKAQSKVWIFTPHQTTASRATRIQRPGETHLLVGHCVIPPEKSCSDVVSHHHVHSVVVMSKEDAEHPNHAECPAKPVIPPESPWGIWKEAQAVIISKRNVISVQDYN